MPENMVCLKQTPALTCSERQVVLDRRERILRQSVNKESDISKARATKGCCPDMCPERERYLREERRRVHTYEMVPGTEAVTNPLYSAYFILCTLLFAINCNFILVTATELVTVIVCAFVLYACKQMV